MFLVKQETNNLSLHKCSHSPVSFFFSLGDTNQLHMFQSDDIKKPSHYAIKKKNTKRHGIKVTTKKNQQQHDSE